MCIFNTSEKNEIDLKCIFAFIHDIFNNDVCLPYICLCFNFLKILDDNLHKTLRSNVKPK